MSEGATKLQYALKNLRVHWDATRESWEDGVARDFEKNHLNLLDSQADKAIRGMQQLGELLAKARRDCS